MFDKLRSWTQRRRAPIDPAAEVAARVMRLVEAGPHPTEVFFSAQPGGRLLTVTDPDQARQSMLLFSSPYYAVDYINETGVEADVAHVKLGALPGVAAAWVEAGVNTFGVHSSRARSVQNRAQLAEG